MTKTLAGLALLAIGWTLSAWLLMLGVGVIHDDWLPALPPLGYATALILTILFGTRMLIRVGITGYFWQLAKDD